MQNFHEHRLWQQAYVALMDIHAILDVANWDDQDKEIVEDLLDAAQAVAAKVADGLSRLDKRFGRQLIYDAVGLVAVVRTQLAIAWGRGILDDKKFQETDNKYADLTNSLQQYK